MMRNRYFFMRKSLWITQGSIAAGMVMLLAACHSNTQSNQQQTGENNISVAEKIRQAYYKNLHGTVNGKAITLQLTKSNQHYDGVFFYDSVARPCTISGIADSSGQITLVTYRQYEPLDTFSGSFPQPGVFQGSWSGGGQGQHASFTLQEVYPEGTFSWQVFYLKDSLLLKPGDSASQRAKIQYSILWPAQRWQVAAQTMVQASISRDLLGLHTTVQDAGEVLKNMTDTFFTAYRKAGAEMPPAMQHSSASMNWESDVRMEVLWNAGNIISMACNRYEFTGGAHGMSTTRLIVWDMQKLRQMTLNDVFKPGYEDTLRAALEKKLRQEYDIPEEVALNDREHGLLFEKHLALSQNFYLTGKGIGFIYNPYEVAPYAAGPIELYIPFTELTSVMNPDLVQEH